MSHGKGSPAPLFYTGQVYTGLFKMMMLSQPWLRLQLTLGKCQRVTGVKPPPTAPSSEKKRENKHMQI